MSLLVVGAGHLGRRVGERWRERGEVLAETRSTARHEALREAGLTPRLREDASPAPSPNVVFAVPPSSTEDYAAEASRAVSLWDGEGGLLMVSSTGVFVDVNDQLVHEDGATADSPRATRLLNAEAHFLSAGGVVVRMAGLYCALRGPHQVYLRQEVSQRGPDGVINLIHYDDAASLVIAALTRGEPGAVYLGCDEHPTSREEIVSLTLASPRFRGDTRRGCRFEGERGQVGKRCDNSWTRARLGWAPRYGTFRQWAALDGEA